METGPLPWQFPLVSINPLTGLFAGVCVLCRGNLRVQGKYLYWIVCWCVGWEGGCVRRGNLRGHEKASLNSNAKWKSRPILYCPVDTFSLLAFRLLDVQTQKLQAGSCSFHFWYVPSFPGEWQQRKQKDLSFLPRWCSYICKTSRTWWCTAVVPALERGNGNNKCKANLNT